ncbi:MAG: AraC family ligand binding domain-containing protein [Clostridia bacterium]
MEDADHHFVTRRPRGRDDYHFLYVASGSVHVWIRGQEQIAKEGTLIYYKLGDPQQYFQDPLSRPEVYWLHFSGRKAGQFIQDLGFQESGLFSSGKMHRSLNCGSRFSGSYN